MTNTEHVFSEKAELLICKTIQNILGCLKDGLFDGKAKEIGESAISLSINALLNSLFLICRDHIPQDRVPQLIDECADSLSKTFEKHFNKEEKNVPQN